MIIPLMAAELFGVKVMGRVMGIIIAADGLGEAFGPMLAAWLRDRSGSYANGFAALIVLAFIGTIAVSLLPSKSRNMIDYRRMTPDDIQAGLALCRSAGWNQVARDWELFLLMSPDGSRVGTDENGKIVGTVTTICYEDYFSWIGMVLVDPARKRQGIGTQLLHEALKILRKEQTVKLDATPAGREVYLKLNFIDEYSLSRMYIKAVSPEKLPASGARAIQESDFPTLVKSDSEVFGANRKEVLEWIWKSAPEFAYIIEENKEISGYCFGRNGYNYIHIGPIVAKDMDHAIQVVSAALHNCGNSPIIIDVNHDSNWLQWLSSIGFTEQRQFTRMYRGSNTWPGIPHKQFAILGPEFG